MRSLLEAGAEKLGVVPQGQDAGNRGQAIPAIDRPLAIHGRQQPAIQHIRRAILLWPETITDNPDTETEPVSTAVENENVPTINVELAKDSSGFIYHR